MTLSNGNRIVEISNYDDFRIHWPFLLEGIQSMRKKAAERSAALTVDEFLKVTISLSLVAQSGRIMLLTSKNGKLLGYIVLCDNTAKFGPKTCVVYALYSTCQCPTTVKDLGHAALLWAKSNEYKRVQGCDYRMNNGSKAFFRSKMQMKLVCHVYEAEII